MVCIRDSSDLRTAYRVLHDMQGLVPLPGREEAAQEHIRQLKKDIRMFLRHQEKREPRRVICDRGIDGYVELARLPDTLPSEEEAAAYFEGREAVQCPDCPGRCTGLAYTCWYRIVCRQGRMWAYHGICYDV